MKEPYGIIYKLVTEVESLEKINAGLRQGNNSLKQQLEKYRAESTKPFRNSLQDL